MGWLTNRRTKPIIINALAAAIRDGEITDYDIIFIRECMTYVIDDQGFTAAQEGMHDDCVMAKAINLQMAQWNSYDLGSVSIYKPTKKKAHATDTSSSLDDIAASGRSGGVRRRAKVVRRRNN
jgi:hypothetical protein